MNVASTSLFVSLTLLSLFVSSAWIRSARKYRDTARELAQVREQQQSQTVELSERSQMDTLKDEFISTVSHELRTPLTSIRGSLGLLSSGVLGALDPQGAEPAPDRGHQHRPANSSDQRHTRPRADAVRPCPLAAAPMLARRSRPAGHRHHATDGRPGPGATSRWSTQHPPWPAMLSSSMGTRIASCRS